MNEWKLVPKDCSEALPRLHFFSVEKKRAKGEIEAPITLKGFATAKTSNMQFYATADLNSNHKTLRFQPCGWSEGLVGGLGECMRNLRKFGCETADESPALPSDCDR